MADSDRLSIRRGGNLVMTLFGLPFFGMGLFFAAAPLFGVVVRTDGGGEASPTVRIVMGSLFALLGAAFMFGRQGFFFDRARGEVTIWYGVLLPMARWTYPTEGATHVVFERRVTRSKNGSSVSFPLLLRGWAAAADDVELCREKTRTAARATAELVAKFAHLGVVDASGGEEVVREAGTLDHSLRERLRDEPPPPPEQPDPGQARLQTEGQTAVLELPELGFLRAGGLGSLLGSVLPLIFLGAFLLPEILKTPTSPGGETTRLVFLCIAGGVLLLSSLPLVIVLFRARMRERLTISPDGVEVEQVGLWTSRQTVPMGELEEIEVAHAPGAARAFLPAVRVLLITDRGQFPLGSALDSRVAHWLADLIRYVAAHGRAPEPQRA